MRERNQEISQVFDLRNKQDMELSSMEMKKTKALGREGGAGIER